MSLHLRIHDAYRSDVQIVVAAAEVHSLRNAEAWLAMETPDASTYGRDAIREPSQILLTETHSRMLQPRPSLYLASPPGLYSFARSLHS